MKVLICLLLILLTSCQTIDTGIKSEISLNPLLFPVTEIIKIKFDLGPGCDEINCLQQGYF